MLNFIPAGNEITHEYCLFCQSSFKLCDGKPALFCLQPYTLGEIFTVHHREAAPLGSQMDVPKSELCGLRHLLSAFQNSRGYLVWVSKAFPSACTSYSLTKDLRGNFTQIIRAPSLYFSLWNSATPLQFSWLPCTFISVSAVQQDIVFT